MYDSEKEHYSFWSENMDVDIEGLSINTYIRIHYFFPLFFDLLCFLLLNLSHTIKNAIYMSI